MFQSVAGIDTDGPGFQRLLIAPRPGPGLTWIKASYRSLHGLIASEWKTEGNTWTWQLTIPANTTATVCVPWHPGATVAVDSDKPQIDAHGQIVPAGVDPRTLMPPGVRFRSMGSFPRVGAEGGLVCSFAAGTYKIVVRREGPTPR